MLEVRGLTFSYAGQGQELFGGLDHTFMKGTVTAIAGPSGRGKSTLLYVLGLLLAPTNGQVIVDGRVASTLPDSDRSELRARRIGFVFQESELDPARRVIDSVLEPALYAGLLRSERENRAHELLTLFGLAERGRHRPGQVSGGQAQRLALCRALLNGPSIILADEPTGNLDRDNSDLVLRHLVTHAHDGHNVVVIATHDPFVMEHCDHVVAL